MIQYFILSLIVGLFTKFSDDIADIKKHKERLRSLGVVLGIVYGTLTGLLMLVDARFFVLIIGIILGNIFSKKIDDINHQIAFLPIIFLLMFAGLPFGINWALAVIFALAAFGDEALNRMSESKKIGKRMSKEIAFIGNTDWCLKSLQ